MQFKRRMHIIAYVKNDIYTIKSIADPTRLRIVRILFKTPSPLCVCELSDIIQKPQYETSRALSRLKSGEIVAEERRGKLRYYRLRRTELVKRLAECTAAVDYTAEEIKHDFDRLRWRLDIRRDGICRITYPRDRSPKHSYKETGMEDTRPRVLFICVHNTARSQIAEAYLKELAGDRFYADSAGLEPGELNPFVVKAMLEDGIDISGNQTTSVMDLYREGHTYSYVITVCSREAEEKCPIFPGPVNRIQWPFPDPSGFTGTDEEIMEKVREIRDAIKAKISTFIEHRRK